MGCQGGRLITNFKINPCKLDTGPVQDTVFHSHSPEIAKTDGVADLVGAV